MDFSRYEYKGKIYTIEHCTKEDIPSHIERVSSYWKDYGVDFDAQTELLEESVEGGNAYKLVDTDDNLYACAYLLPVEPEIAQAVLGWFHTKVAYAIGCFFVRTALGLRIITLMPHTTNFIPYRFTIDENSIRSFHDLGTPLVIRLHDEKNITLYKEKFRDKGVKVL